MGGLGAAWSGTPARQTGFAQNFNPQVQSQFAQFANSAQNYDITRNPLYGEIGNTYSSMMKPFDPSQSQQYFEQGVANPAMKYYEQNILPQIRSNYYQPGAVQGSALNQAITGSAENLSQGLASLRANYLQQAQGQHEAQRNQAAASALGLIQAPGQQQLQYYNQLFNTRDVTPMIQEAQSGPLQDILGLVAQLGGAYLSGGGTAFLGPLLSSLMSKQQQQPSTGYGALAGRNAATGGY